MNLVVSLFILLLLQASTVAARVYGGEESVVGYAKTYTIKKGDSLVEIARRFGLGFNEIAEANPDVDPFVPERGTRIVIPSAWILPDVPPTASIVINLSELRLYHFYNAGSRRKVATYPVGIGSEGNDTPLGSFRIKEKREFPSWRVPRSILRERTELPPVVPPGDENPLGTHALRLSNLSILIHGTNRPFGVGRRVSHGCIRLYPEDIPLLFERAAIEEGVMIVRQPVKLGTKGERIFIEVHADPAETDYLNYAAYLLVKKDMVHRVDFQKVFQAITDKRGVPVEITGALMPERGQGQASLAP